MTDQKPRPDWAPDDAKDAVIQLITNEQQLEDLGLRGLSSADSAEFREATRKLHAQLGAAFAAGKQSRPTYRRRPGRSTSLRESLLVGGGVTVGLFFGIQIGRLLAGI